MESSALNHRRRPSHVRENSTAGPDRPFLVKRNRGKSREQARMLSDDDNTPMSRGENRRRKKKTFSSSPNIPSTSGHHPGPSVDPIVERAHKSHKYKHDVSRTFPDATSLARTISREGRRPSTKVPSVAAASDDDAGPQASYSGPIATMEFNRMKKELETLKKVCPFLYLPLLRPTNGTHGIYPASNGSKENDRKASKCGLDWSPPSPPSIFYLSDIGIRLMSLENDLLSMHQTQKEQLSQMDALKTKFRESDELASNIEGSLQCQICIDTLTKPFALYPCGHVLCQGCLQDWFRNAPVPQDEMEMDEPLPLILRKKTCPFCRTNPTDLLRPSPPPDLEDPWAEIFPQLQSDSESGAEDDEDYSDGWPLDVMYDDDDDDEDEDLFQGYDNTSDDEYEGEWVMPGWEPPAHRAATPLDPEPATDMLLRRGATYGMIEMYDVQYSHEEGLSALVDDTCLYLGWNIEIAEEDEDGERFVAWCLGDTETHPHRWFFSDHGHRHRLIRREALEEYNSTDSENWIGTDDDDDVDAEDE
ncbi:hypothetical protein H4582DRAFT_2074572 [Lactarius indigo]|nr:hypothetical protein H4582DRAFT_2074572 [Lactarius indigo]